MYLQLIELMVLLLYMPITPLAVVLTLYAETIHRRSLAILIGATYSLYLMLLALLTRNHPQLLMILPGGITIYIDGISRTYLFLIGSVSLLVYIFLSRIPPQIFIANSFNYTVLNILIASSSLLVIAWDWMIFVVLWEIAGFAAYYVIRTSMENTGPDYTYYLTIHVGGLAVIAGAALLIGNGIQGITMPIPPSQYVPAILLCIGFASKTGLFPFHYWLQPVYRSSDPVYPSLLSSFIDGLGIYGIYRVAQSYIEPGTNPLLANILLVAGSLSIIIAAVWYWGTRDYPGILAWSTLYNMGWLLIAVAIGNPLVLALFLLSHGYAKVAAFLTVKLYGPQPSIYRSFSGTAAVLGATTILAIEGIPPFSLFFARLMVLADMIDAVGIWCIPVVLGWITSSIFFYKLLSMIMFPRGSTADPVQDRSNDRTAVSAISVLLGLSIASYLVLIALGVIEPWW